MLRWEPREFVDRRDLLRAETLDLLLAFDWRESLARPVLEFPLFWEERSFVCVSRELKAAVRACTGALSCSRLDGSSAMSFIVAVKREVWLSLAYCSRPRRLLTSSMIWPIFSLFCFSVS